MCGHLLKKQEGVVAMARLSGCDALKITEKRVFWRWPTSILADAMLVARARGLRAYDAVQQVPKKYPTRNAISLVIDPSPLSIWVA